MNANPLHDLAMIRKVSLYCAAAVLVVSCLMSFKFGWSMSVLHAIGLAFITICTALMPPFIGHQWKSGSRAYAVAMLPILVLLGLVEFGTHTGYTNGVRTIETEGATVQNAAYDLKQESAKRNAAQLAAYKADLEKLREANPWVATVSPDGLRAQLAPMQLAIEQEKARGGCGPKCLALTKDKAAIEDRIAVAERGTQIGQQIALLEAEVNKREDVAVTAEFRSSEVVAQTNIFAKAVAWSLEPSAAEKEGTQIGVGFAMALATTFLPAVFMLMAFGPAEFVPGHAARTAVSSAPYSTADAQVSALRDMVEKMQRRPVAPVSAPSTHTKELMVVKEDDPRAKQAYDALSQLVEEARQLKAAA